MVNCRSISAATWKQASDALVFYFRQRVGLGRAEDLAQDTLAAFLRREDFEFEKEEDFLRVCYAFAGLILKAARRQDKELLAAELKDPMLCTERNAFGLNEIEMRLYMDEVLAAARAGLLEREWRSIESRARFEVYGDVVPGDSTEKNRRRVEFHRSKGKLAKLLNRGKKP